MVIHWSEAQHTGSCRTFQVKSKGSRNKMAGLCCTWAFAKVSMTGLRLRHHPVHSE